MRAGILERATTTMPDLVDDDPRDPSISERQKQALLEIYRSFQRERAEERGEPTSGSAEPTRRTHR